MDLQLQEMRRTGDARIVVADALFATGLQRVFLEIEAGCRDLSQVFFDDTLVLRGRRNDAGLEDCAVATETIAVIEDTAGRLSAGMAHGGLRYRQDKGP